MSDKHELSDKHKGQIARFLRAANEFSEALKARDGTDQVERRICQAKAEVWSILNEPLEG